MGTVYINYLSDYCYLGYDPTLDPYSPSVQLLMNFEEAPGSSTFTDESYSQLAGVVSLPTATSVVISDAQKPFGSTSAYFSGGGYLRRSATNMATMANAAFTMEMMVNFSSLTGSSALLSHGTASAAANAWSIRASTTGIRFSWSLNASTEAGNIFFPTTLAINTWYHIALVKVKKELRLFIDGALTGGVQTLPTPSSFITTGSYLLIGAASATENKFSGYMKGLRLTTADRYNSCAVEPADVYPEVITANPAPRLYYTSEVGDSLAGHNLLLLHFDGLDGSKEIKDSSIYNRVHEPLDSSTGTGLSQGVKKFGISSMYFNGTTPASFLRYPGPFRFYDDPFTIAFWIYPLRNSVVGGETLANFGLADQSQPGGIHIVRAFDGTIDFTVAPLGGPWHLDGYTDSFAQHPVVVPSGQWTHIALERNIAVGATGQSWTLYVNGIYMETADSSLPNRFILPECDVFIGRRANLDAGYTTGLEGFTGYIDDFVLTKSAIRWEREVYTVPTEPWKDLPIRDPFFRNVVLLVNGEFPADGSSPISDKSLSKRIPLNLGSCTLSVDQYLATFGDYSIRNTVVGENFIAFDTSTDWDLCPGGVLTGNENFTIECWIRHLGAVSEVGWISRQDVLGTNGWYLATDAAGKPVFAANVGGGIQILLQSTVALAVNTSYHLAVVRRYNVLWLYVNGVNRDSYTLTSPIVDATGEALIVGAKAGIPVLDPSRIIDEVRFTKGIARYTSGTTSFDVIRAPFPTN